MLKWPKKPLLAVLAALTAVGLGVPCAMADGTAAATAYISVEAAGGTTLDGRTYKAYRLGSYGKTDVRVDQDSGDRYAASIPVSTDPDRADAVAVAGSKAGFTGDDMLAAAWASTDSAKLEAFARGLALSLSDAEPAASVEGASRMGPFTPGVYLVSGSDGSACLTGTLPSEGVGDRSHVLGIAEFEGDAQAAAAPQANSDESLATLDDDGDTSGSPMARYAAPTTVYHRLFDGTVTSTALDNEDPAISIYTGGNLNYMNNLEVEGSVIVNGNLTNGRGLVAGRANWGMGYTPPKNSVMLAVGGDYTSASTTDGNNWNRGAVGGKAWIGGRDNRVIPLDSLNTIHSYGLWSTWFISGQTNVKSISNMGHDAALKVDIDGKGTIVDYNDYVDRQLQPLSTQLANETPTGKVGYARGTDSTETVWLSVNGRNDDGSMKYNGQKDTVTVTGDEGVITFTGDGKKHTQVFDLDMDKLENQRKALRLLQWGVDFENVPGDTAIVVNVRGSGSRTWNTGWRYWVNGRKVNIGVNQQDGAYNDFRKLASRVLWNWTDASYVKYDESHGIMHINSTHNKAQDGKDSYEGGPYGSAASPGKASNLPGTVLAPKANVRMRCDQNGRLLVGKDLTLDVWEHHNNPWVGFVGDNSVTVDAATTASHDGVDVGTTKAVHDSISLRNNGKKYGAAVAKATVTLNYSASTDGRTADEKATKATGAIQVAAGKTVSADSPDFTPSDLGMKTWQPGRYWFDLSVEEKDLSVTGTARYETSDVGNVAGLSGLTDSSEQWTITPTSAPTISTRAMAGDARVGGTQKVHDSITVTNHDPNRAITIAKVTTTLHMRTGNRKASKTIGPVTIPAGGSRTFDSADFVPSDLRRKCWSAGLYWFDATVAAADATYPSGAQALSADLVHDGKNDTAQKFNLTMDGLNGFSTQAQGTFSTAGGTSSVHDRLVVTTGADSLADDLSVKVTLNWASSPAATKAEASATKADVVPAGSDHKDLRDFAPSDLKMTTWKAGRYWYDVEIPAQEGVDDAITLHGLTKDTAKESWIVAEPTAGLTTKTDAPAGLTDLSATPVHDTVTAKTIGYPTGSTFAATLTLNYQAADGTTAKAKAVTFRAAINGSTKSPDVTPALFGWKTWRIGHYWFDLSAVDPNDKTITVPGANDANEQFDVGNHTTKATLAITTQAAKSTASTTNADPVHDTVRLSAAGAALTVARVHVRLNYPKADGTTATAVKDTGSITVPKNGSESIASPAFTPSDLGLGDLWPDNTAGTYYWFDVWVDKADVALSGDTGVMALSGSLSHEGRTDAAEQFRLDRQAGKATTTAAGTFARAGGTAATHDTLHLAFPGARTLKATSTLHYAADAAAVKADASKAKAVTVAANGDVAGPSFAPSDFGWSSWKAGRYWYDLDIPAQSGYNALAVDGLTDKAEQWTAVVPFALDLAKLAYIGQPGQGRWSNEPVKGAVFTLTEAADASGSTAKPGTSPRTVTTDANGAAHLLDGVIGATGDRWFRLAETKAPASYALPSSGTYWMVHVKGGADKASVTVVGSNAEAKALLKDLSGSTVTVGNRLEGNIMPPMTGGRYDVARAGALAGAVTLGLLIAGCVVLRRRNTSPLDR